MKRPTLKGRFGDTESSPDEQTTEAVVDALMSNDKVIEIRPAKQSGTFGAKRLLLLAAGAVGLAYWVRKSQKPDELIQTAKEKTTQKPDELIKTAKEKTLSRTDQAAETIEKGSETASERIETGSQRAGEAVQEAGEEAADRTEQAGEKAAEKAEEKTDDDNSSFSRD